jgi:cytochrome c peroxidase
MLLPMFGFAADLPQKVGSDLIVTVSKSTDNSGFLDTPQLSNIALTAPYLHDGTARSLEEIWTVFNPDDKHGRTNNLTKDELNDLVEYLRTR